MTVEAPAARESGQLETLLASLAFRHAAGAAIASGLIGIAANRFHPTAATTPLIAGPARGYYLLAIAIILVATFAVIGVRIDGEAPHKPAPWDAGLLALGAATFVFASFRSPAAILGFSLFTAVTAYVAQVSRDAAPISAAAIARYAATIVVLLLFAAGLFEYRMRTLYAAPPAMLAAILGFRQLSVDQSGREMRLSESLVAAVVAGEMIWALGFLKISAWLAAAIWTVAIVAVVYGVSAANEDHSE
jgi:hypothetical protein